MKQTETETNSHSVTSLPAASMRRRAGREAWRGWLVHQVGSPELPEPSTLPVDDSATSRRTSRVGHVAIRSVLDVPGESG